jgi:6-phosphofructokinase 1
MQSKSILTQIPTLGEAKIPSPVQNRAQGANGITFVSDQESVVIDVNALSLIQQLKDGQSPACFEMAGPRDNIFFDPSKLRCALVTCGGLCPHRPGPGLCRQHPRKRGLDPRFFQGSTGYR